MTVAESKGLKKGGRVYWRGDAAADGSITEISWDATTIGYCLRLIVATDFANHYRLIATLPD